MDQLDLLPSLYGRIIVPPAVYAEVSSGGTGSTDLVQAPWLTIQAPGDQEAVVNLRQMTRLDAGESEAIILAGELGALLIVDEYQGRQIAQARGIQIIGTVGLVVAACHAGHLAVDDVEPLLRRMTRARFRISDRLIRHAVALARAHR